MTVRPGIAAILLVLMCATAVADTQSPLASNVVQRIGATLPLDVPVRDETGREAPLQRYFDDVPVLLVFGYYRCPTLCTTFMESVLLGVTASGLAPRSYRILGVSIDPRETPLDALRKKALYAKTFAELPLTLLTATEGASRRLADAAGVSYAFDSRAGEYTHPVGFLVISPQGRITRYFPGIGFDSGDVRLALIEASESRLGSLSDRIFLRCAHYDPATGRYSVAVMSVVRAVCGVLIAVLGLWIWRRRGGA